MPGLEHDVDPDLGEDMLGRHWTLSIALATSLGMAGCGDGSPTGPGVPESRAWQDVTAGLGHACALDAEGVAYCWGDNGRGQLGDGTRTSSAVPVQVIDVPALVSIDAADDGTCGLAESGAAYCWGRNDAGQLGNGVLGDSPVPVQVLAGPFESMSVGSYMACGIDSDERLTCWGADRYDAVLSGTREVCPGPNVAPFWRCASVPVERPAAGAFRAVSVGTFHVCGVRPSGQTVCWGMGRFGQLGVPATDLCPVGVSADEASTPCLLSPGTVTPEMTRVSSGASHSCGLAAEGRAHCWGALFFDYGQLGTGREATATPTPVAEPASFTRIYTAAVNFIFTFSCALDSDGTASCWGAGDQGQLGRAPTSECSGVLCATVPGPVTGGARFEALALGGGFVCGIAVDDEVYCWGRNDDGQLGRGSFGTGGADPRPVVFSAP